VKGSTLGPPISTPMIPANAPRSTGTRSWRERLKLAGLLLVAASLLGLLPSSGTVARQAPALVAARQPDQPHWTAEAPEANPANLLHNSSLEVCTAPGIPDYWRPGEAWSDFRERNFGVSYAVEDSGARFHSRCVRLTNTRATSKAALDYPYMSVPDKSRPCVFSVYLRADRPAYPVRIGIYGGFDRTKAPEECEVDSNSVLKAVKVGTEWQRYVIVSPPFRPGSTVRNRVVVLAEGVGSLLIDGLQLESGERPSDYGPRPGDDPPPTAPTRPDIMAHRTLRPVMIDGVLDEREWQRATPAEAFRTLSHNHDSETMTRARVMFDEDAVYVGFVCQEGLKPLVGAGLFQSDHVEVFVSGQPDGAGYRQYAVDVQGRTYASAGQGDEFESGLEARAAPGQGRWSAEMRIPFGEIGLPLDTPKTIRLNLARYRAASGEWSAYSFPGASLHTAEVFVSLSGLDPRTLESYGSGPLSMEVTHGPDAPEIQGVLRVRAADGADLSAEVTAGGEAVPTVTSRDGDAVCFVASPVDLPEQTRATVAVAVSESATGKLLARRTARNVRIPPPYEVFFERSYYTTEQFARLVIISHCAEPTPLEVTEEVPVAPTAGAPPAPETESAPAVQQRPLGRVSIDRRGIGFLSVSLPPAGADRVSVCRVKAGQREVGAAKLVIRPPRQNEVKVDYLRRTLVVGGAPMVVVAPGWLAEENIPAVADGEFNAVMQKRWHEPTGAVYATGNVTDESLASLRSFLDSAWARGMRVMFHLPMKLNDNNCVHDEEAVKKLVETFMDHPALLAWDTVDEPGPRATPEKLLRIANLVRRLDPYHPVWINEATFWDYSMDYARQAQPACDVFSVDHYPVPDLGVPTVATWAERLNEVGRWRKPQWLWLQAFGAIEWWPREPTPGEERAMVYLALIHDMRGIMYFVYRPRSQALWDECKRLAREIRAQVSPVLADTILTRQIDTAFDSVHAALLETEHSGTYLMAVNVGSGTLEFPLRAPGLGMASPTIAAVVLAPQGYSDGSAAPASITLGPSGACLVKLADGSVE